MNLKEKYPFLKEEDAKDLNNAINQIKKLQEVIGIVQMGSSTQSEDYKDIDVMIFFDSFLVPPELGGIRNKYNNKKLWLEGASIHYEGHNPGFKVFIKFFSHIKNKKILYGKDPFENKKIILNKSDVAKYVWYHYHICEMYGIGYDNVLPVSMNGMLAYQDIFPDNKNQTLEFFKEKFPELARNLPKNEEKFLRETNKSNFNQLRPFFENSIKYFLG